MFEKRHGDGGVSGPSAGGPAVGPQEAAALAAAKAKALSMMLEFAERLSLDQLLCLVGELSAGTVPTFSMPGVAKACERAVGPRPAVDLSGN